MPAVVLAPETIRKPKSRDGDGCAKCVRKSHTQARPQPQPQLWFRGCCHLNNTLTCSPTTSSATGTSSPSPSYPNNLTVDSHQSIELVRRPEAAYLSPHRALPSFESFSSPSSITLNECCAPSSPQSTSAPTTMGLSKTQRIAILLAIDTVFFLIELIIGEWYCSGFQIFSC